jgi:hypothetical protein
LKEVFRQCSAGAVEEVESVEKADTRQPELPARHSMLARSIEELVEQETFRRVHCKRHMPLRNGINMRATMLTCRIVKIPDRDSAVVFHTLKLFDLTTYCEKSLVV